MTERREGGWGERERGRERGRERQRETERGGGEGVGIYYQSVDNRDYVCVCVYSVCICKLNDMSSLNYSLCKIV